MYKNSDTSRIVTDLICLKAWEKHAEWSITTGYTPPQLASNKAFSKSRNARLSMSS